MSSVGVQDRRFGEAIVNDDDVINDVESSDGSSLIEFINSDIIGADQEFMGPWGPRKVVYCDFTASGRSMKCIEQFVSNEVLPFYGNTHSSVTVTAEQSTLYLHEARDTIRNAVHASEHDAVIFCGAGSTSAVHVLAHALCAIKPLIVFVSEREHHSNLLPWKNIAQQMIYIPDDKTGKLDLVKMQKLMEEHMTANTELLSCLSACSNVTGILEDVDKVSTLVHSYGGRVVWDYASCAPYVNINMHPLSENGLDSSKDAIFFSGHKFIGGVQSPGVLIASKSWFRNENPLKSGGGTVFFVRPSEHRYLKNVEYREEGGTGDIVGCIRLAMAIKLKLSVGVDNIQVKDQQIIRYVQDKWCNIANLHILGPEYPGEKLPIFSFMISDINSGLLLHHNFVCGLLDNLFGIQTRGGCLCAGPYIQKLLGIDETLAQRFEKTLAEDDRLDRSHLRRENEYSPYEILRPGVVRVSLSYFMTWTEINYVVEAVAFVAQNGFKFLPQYKLNPESGEWHHKNQPVFRDRKWMARGKFTSQGFLFDSKKIQGAPNFQGNIIIAQELANNCKQDAMRMSLQDMSVIFDENAAQLRWFLLPSEAHNILLQNPHSKYPPQILSLNCQRLCCDENTSSITPKLDLSSLQIQQPSDSSTTMNVKPTDSKIATVPNSRKNRKAQGCAVQIWDERTIVEANLIVNAPLRFRWHTPPSAIFKLMSEAMEQFEMIRNGDKVLVCLSGGKDSLSLLHSLRQFQFRSKSQGVNFELAAVTVDPGSSSYDPSVLIDYMQGLNMPYFYEQQNIVDQALSLDNLSSICSFCSRMKRGRLYSAARTHKYNVLAFGQHLDDLAESLLMNMFHGGRLRTMKAHYIVKEGDLRVIRPLVYVREKSLRQFAETCKLPIIPENCPACFDTPKERHRCKQLLASQEVLFPKLFNSLGASIKQLLMQQYDHSRYIEHIEHIEHIETVDIQDE